MRLVHRIGRAAFAARLCCVVGVLLVAGALAACGGDGCGGFISINASPEDCERRAEELGCSSFETDGPTCGLLGCVRCEETN